MRTNWAGYCAVDTAVYWAVAEGMNQSVHWAMVDQNQVVGHAVRAVNAPLQVVATETAHPALSDFLSEMAGAP